MEEANEIFTKAKSGSDKKAYVINKMGKIANKFGFDGFKKEKISETIEDKMKSLINKI